MIVNFTENYQFHTRLQIKDKDIQVVDKIKILGTTFTNKITWDENCSILIRKVNASEKSLELWLKHYRNGPLVEDVLFEHPRAVMCGLG